MTPRTPAGKPGKTHSANNLGNAAGKSNTTVGQVPGIISAIDQAEFDSQAPAAAAWTSLHQVLNP